MYFRRVADVLVWVTSFDFTEFDECSVELFVHNLLACLLLHFTSLSSIYSTADGIDLRYWHTRMRVRAALDNFKAVFKDCSCLNRTFRLDSKNPCCRCIIHRHLRWVLLNRHHSIIRNPLSLIGLLSRILVPCCDFFVILVRQHRRCRRPKNIMRRA